MKTKQSTTIARLATIAACAVFALAADMAEADGTTLRGNGGSIHSKANDSYCGGEMSSSGGLNPSDYYAKRTGYDFTGWIWVDVDNNGHDTYDAVWKAHQWTLFFNVNADDPKATVSPTSRPVYYDDQYGALPVATRPGYTFSHWRSAAQGASSTITSTSIHNMDDDRTIYASWTAKQPTYQGGTVTFIKGVFSAASIATADTEGLPATYRDIYGKPNWMTLAPDGTLSGTPPSVDSRSIRVAVRSSNGSSEVTAEWTLNVLDTIIDGLDTTNIPVRVTGIAVDGATGDVGLTWDALTNRTVLAYTVRGTATLDTPVSAWDAAAAPIQPPATNRVMRTLSASPLRFFQVWAEVLK